MKEDHIEKAYGRGFGQRKADMGPRDGKKTNSEIHTELRKTSILVHSFQLDRTQNTVRLRTNYEIYTELRIQLDRTEQSGVRAKTRKESEKREESERKRVERVERKRVEKEDKRKETRVRREREERKQKRDR